MLYISTVCVFVSIYKPTLFPTQSTTVERSISLEIQIYHGRLLGGKIKLVSEANYCLFMALFLLLLQFYLTFATQIPFHQVDLFVRLHFSSLYAVDCTIKAQMQHILQKIAAFILFEVNLPW